jgi:CRP-like cAMP-binding protein
VTVEPERLRSIPLFAGLSEDERHYVAAWMETRHAQPGDRVVPEGAPGYEFFIVEDGTVEVVQDAERIRTLGPGEFFGEMALVGSATRRVASVVATAPLRLLVIHGLHLRELEARQPEVAARIRETVASRLDGGVSR